MHVFKDATYYHINVVCWNNGCLIFHHITIDKQRDLSQPFFFSCICTVCSNKWKKLFPTVSADCVFFCFCFFLSDLFWINQQAPDDTYLVSNKTGSCVLVISVPCVSVILVNALSDTLTCTFMHRQLAPVSLFLRLATSKWKLVQMAPFGWLNMFSSHWEKTMSDGCLLSTSFCLLLPQAKHHRPTNPSARP